jgi:hypothetical protein
MSVYSMAFTNRVRRVFRRKVGKTVNGKNVYQGLRGGLFTHNNNGKNSTVYRIGSAFSTNPNYVPIMNYTV